MSPGRGHVFGLRVGPPRASGDEPITDVLTLAGPVSAPRERG